MPRSQKGRQMSDETGTVDTGGAGDSAPSGGNPGGGDTTALAGGAAPESGTALTSAAPETPAAPESYADFNVQKGVELPAGQMDAFKAAAKEAGWSQEVAQAAFDTHTKLFSEDTKARTDTYEKQVNDWLKTSKADQEFGGQEYDANLKMAVSAIEKFGTPELSQLLNEYGIGNHPELIRFAFRVGKAIADDTVEGAASGGAGGGSNDLESVAKRLYG